MVTLPHGFNRTDWVDLLSPGRFSGIVSIVHNGQERLIFTSGLSNRQTGRAITRTTRFLTASVSKMFTALCVARLIEKGMCGFEQPVGEIVPSLAPHLDSSVTLVSLLSHRSGLGDYIDDEAALPFAGMDVARLDCLEAFLPLVLNVTRHQNGKFRYSSAGYVWLGLAIERITNLSFPEAIAQWLTRPAGLTSTGFPRIDAVSDDLAVGYLADGSSNLGRLPVVGGPDGGIVTSLSDLLILFGQLRNDSLISRKTLDFLLRPLSKINDRLSYGCGFYISKVHGQTWYGHTGSDPGLSARVAFSLQSDSSIVVLSNCDNLAFPVFRLAENWLSTEINAEQADATSQSSAVA
jgi:CubicO group peptidase (beta-lactamase class C family)